MFVQQVASDLAEVNKSCLDQMWYLRLRVATDLPYKFLELLLL